jgi:hypothetical protein
MAPELDADVFLQVADFTRYLNNSKGVYWQVLFVPLIMSTLGVFGIIGTSCAKVRSLDSFAGDFADKQYRLCMASTSGTPLHWLRCGTVLVEGPQPSSLA